MQVIGFDTETALIRPAQQAPAMVCLTWATRGIAPQIVHHTVAANIVHEWLSSRRILFVGHNVAYDLGVVCERFPALVPLVFAAYEQDRVTDTKIRQQLLDIAGGRFRGEPSVDGKWFKHGYTLEEVARRMAGIQLQKDGWRYSYGEFLDVPIEKWISHAEVLQDRARLELATEGLSEERTKHLTALVQSEPEQCIHYPLQDAVATLAVYEAQERHAHELGDQFRQARAAWWLHLSSAWGIRTCP